MTLDRATAERLLHDLAVRLDAADIAVTIHVVGGAAVMLTARPDRVATVDVDSWINCGADDAVRAAVLNAAAAVARGNPGVSDGWLNERASGFIPDSVGGNADEWLPLIAIGSVRVVVARADLLLAMKLRAGRGRRDLPDAEALITACGLSTITEIERVFANFYPHDEINPRARAWLEGRWQA